MVSIIILVYALIVLRAVKLFNAKKCGINRTCNTAINVYYMDGALFDKSPHANCMPRQRKNLHDLRAARSLWHCAHAWLGVLVITRARSHSLTMTCMRPKKKEREKKNQPLNCAAITKAVYSYTLMLN